MERSELRALAFHMICYTAALIGMIICAINGSMICLIGCGFILIVEAILISTFAIVRAIKNG